MISALLLSAGLGTRLDPLTRLVAKPAVPLGDRTLIEHVIQWLSREGVQDVVLNLHHRPASVAAVIGDGTHLGISARFSWEQPVLGSAGGPRHALPLVTSDPFLVVNGDTLCDFALAPMLRAHLDSGADVTMAVIPNPNKGHYNGLRVSQDRALLGFVPRGHVEQTFHFIGVQIVNRSVFAGLPDGESAETVAGIYPTMIARRPGSIRVWPVTTSFLDVGTPWDYFEAAMSVADEASRSTQVVVWPGATVAPTARLRECIVAGSVRVPERFEAHTSILVPASVVRPGDDAKVAGDLAVFPLRKP